MDIDLSGRSALISGSTQGIGRAIAAKLAGCGAAVTINGRDEAMMSAIRLTRGSLPGMVERGWGHAQLMASDSAVVIPEEMLHYGVTKTALLGVSRGFAKAVKGSGVTADSVIADPTHTEGVEAFVYELVGFDKRWDEAQRQFVAEHRPNSLLGRLIEPDEIANFVAYLASDLASATTGGAVRVDGGYVDHILP